VERLNPFPAKTVIRELSRYPKARIIWCQEEPKNMGAWTHVDPWLEWCIEKAGVKQGGHAAYAGRPSAASPATGQMKKHLIEQATLVDAALTK